MCNGNHQFDSFKERERWLGMQLNAVLCFGYRKVLIYATAKQHFTSQKQKILF